MSLVGSLNARLGRNWSKLTPDLLPFADVGTAELPMIRLLRLSLFQVSVGMAVVLLIGTLNRVMIVELGVPAWLVGAMVALPLVFAPLRALVGFKSDTHKSVLGWKRVPYIWMGTLLQFGGLSIMPFALIILSGDTNGPLIIGQAAAALAFLLVGAGMHSVQTVGLALATDIAPRDKHPQVVALLCVMMMVGMVLSALLFGIALAHFSEIRLIQVIQGSALATMVLNVVALWKQEERDTRRTDPTRMVASFKNAWAAFSQGRRTRRQLLALGLGTAAFSMQDILLEPYGGQILHLTVGMTTGLTAGLAAGGLVGFGLAARILGNGADPYRLAGHGVLVGLVAFSAVIFSAPLGSTWLFGGGVMLIGLGAGLFAHCTLTAAMGMAGRDQVGLVLGVWGAVQATAAGGAVAISGFARDGISALAVQGGLGEALASPATGYGAVYATELVLLFVTLVALGPLVRSAREPVTDRVRDHLRGAPLPASFNLSR
jgi:BCD family chlorophyll transporter-like MFS transporter